MKKTIAFCAVFAALTVSFAQAQNQPAACPYCCNMPVSVRTQETGCYIVAQQKIDHLPAGQLFWHIYSYPTVQQAKEAQGSSAATVVESLGKVWLFNIAAANWRPEGGKQVAMVGPLQVFPDKQYEARYLEGAIPSGRPGTPVHRHPGPEAWYVLSGGQCMQTPGKTELVRAHGTAVIPGGTPMRVSFPLNDTTRQLVLVLYDDSQPWMTKAQDWAPTSTCPTQ
jgi:mannose-6-phosphate isomerase-like protein (cupin superfamily)